MLSKQPQKQKQQDKPKSKAKKPTPFDKQGSAERRRVLQLEANMLRAEERSSQRHHQAQLARLREARFKVPAPTAPPPVFTTAGLGFNANGGGDALQLVATNPGFSGRGLVVKTGASLSDVVFNGICDPSQDPRWPDQFSLMKTTDIIQTSSLQVNTVNTSSVEGGYTYVGGLTLFGTNKVPGVSLTHITDGTTPDPDPLVPGDVPVWNTGTPMASLYASADFTGRICGQVFDLVFNLQGINHSIEVNAFPIVPHASSTVTAKPSGWPTHLKAGPTDLHVSWGARSWHISSGDDPIRFVTIPMDTRGLDFRELDQERLPYGSANGQAWSGWVIWFNGLSAADVVRVVCTATWEILPIPATTTMYYYPSSTRPSDSKRFDAATKTVASSLEAGLGAFETAVKIADTVHSISSTLHRTRGGANVEAMARLLGATRLGQRFSAPDVGTGHDFLVKTDLGEHKYPEPEKRPQVPEPLNFQQGASSALSPPRAAGLAVSSCLSSSSSSSQTLLRQVECPARR